MQQNPTNIPFYRDVRVLKVLFQILFVLGVFLLAGILYANMLKGLESRGLNLKLDFWSNEAGFDVSDSIIEYDASDSYLKAFYVGVLNTVRVSLAGILCATVLGLFFGIARLSTNWLVRNIAATYIEIFRNVPLLLQIVFWFAIFGALPAARDSVELFNAIYINNRSIHFPSLQLSVGFSSWVGYLYAAAVLSIISIFVLALIFHRKQVERMEEGDDIGYFAHVPRAAKWSVVPVFFIVAIIGWFLVPESPFVLVRPELQRFNVVGGIRFSASFISLLIGLSVYTGAFIAEVVRSGIQAVSKGQREAARSVGLSTGQTLRLIVLPQAVPIIIPPLTSQYLNLAKNSSLAAAVGYDDLFQVGKRIMTKAGKEIPVFAMIMINYLTMSLITSAAMNWYNSWVNRINR
ncbi:ABC transporter permease subunit [Candidatus Poribacteria bacterium]|nr:ABC transporter permease subunit [Candidatus Poribacteria bacterium]